ncbi:hypothetical protein J6590_060268 [Homalodisca vitripennis]|nr:hypothetical protein J6590_060268 [Homalodisca vitripennis]
MSAKGFEPWDLLSAVSPRTSELVALMAISSTLFLFLHTRELHTKLRQMETRGQPEDLTANQLSEPDKFFGSVYHKPQTSGL